MQSRRQTKVLLVFGLWLLAIAFFLVVLVGYISRRGEGVRSPHAETQQWRGSAITVTLVQAVQRAEPRAKAWASDATLIWINGKWRPGRDWTQTNMPQPAWSLYYYSPSAQAMASVAVGEEDVFWVPPVRMRSSPAPLSTLPPAYDIDVAWISFRASGGDAFLKEHPGAMIDFRLQQEGERLVWSVSAFRDNAQLAVSMDAQSGTVILPQAD